MFQAVVQTGSRSELGQHYTSVPNILKTIEPLFLDELREAFDDAYSSVPRLEKLLDRIGKIKVFDPACGSGNFLVIAYKELRRLEHAILDRLAHLSPKHQTLFSDSVVKIDHFYGIEIDDFAAEVAVLSLWIAKHQMNREYKEKFGVDLPMIPLRSMGQIRCANACRIDWNEVCPHTPEEEVYLIGNPPYVGSRKRRPEQTEDLQFAYGEQKFSKNIDYISAWFIKGGRYISGSSAQLAFITTNSINQGEHVGLLFPDLFAMGLEIGYAYTSFKWSNSAKHNAGVTVSVVSLRKVSKLPHHLFGQAMSTEVEHINGFLSSGPSLAILRRKEPISDLPTMAFGSVPRDGGNLLLNRFQKDELLLQDKNSERFIKNYVGSAEFIRGEDRYCLWIDDEDILEATAIEGISSILENVSKFRSTSKATVTQEFAKYPHRFWWRAYKPTNSIIVPSVSSERRTYVPMGYLGPDTVISNAAFAVYDAEPWLFALLTSKMHMAWLRAVGGKMKTDYRYSNTIVYNNFPVPHLTGPMKEKLTQAALRILDVREYFCEKTLAELYDPEEMPELLCEAHAENDALVDSIYRKSGFESDEDRLAALFTLYQKMSDEQDSAPARSRKKKAK